MTIGRDLLDLPFAELVRNLAVAIADGQAALDHNSIETMRALASTEVRLITNLTDTIMLDRREVPVQVPDGEGGMRTETVVVSGARVTTAADTQGMTMLQAGLQPTFYQFAEATIEVRLSISMRDDHESAASGRTSAGFGLGLSRAFATSVDFRTAAKYQYQAQGSSLLRVLMRPVPPPARLEPSVTTINTLVQPATVTRTP